MHASSFENMQYCYEHYVYPSRLMDKPEVSVLDVGGANINGSYGDIFNQPPFKYYAADIAPGPGVDVVLQDAYRLPFPDGSVDIVLSGQMLEHCEFFWRSFQEFMRVVSEDGFVFLIAPSAGEIHRYPVDCYRFYPDGYKALAAYADCHLVEIWRDERGPWRDLVGVFRKTGAPLIAGKYFGKPLHKAPGAEVKAGAPAEEATRGEISTHQALKLIHGQLNPRFYLEIGVRHGQSLALARCRALGVDPAPEITHELPESAGLITKTSDDFFRQDAAALIDAPIDLALIDGMHRFEYVLRDFMNIEKRSHKGTVVAIDDVYPAHPAQAARKRQTRVWTGDVYKIINCLRLYRPDLRLTLLDTSPTGLLLISGLDSQNRILWEQYNEIIKKFNQKEPQEPDQAILRRQVCARPEPGVIKSALDGANLPEDKNCSGPYASGQTNWLERVKIKDDAGESVPKKLSVVLITYNMRREFPRTLLSLSPKMQRGIREDDYEIIIIDNGSGDPFDQAYCQGVAANARYYNVSNPSVSPAPAVNVGIRLANSDLIGVFIDGARIASPWLLCRALEASRVHPRPVIGACAFHLGPGVQMQTVRQGYNQTAEDKLLDAVKWEEDSYRLFQISCFAGSSYNGWFALPNETNSFFLSKALWSELDGYDLGFTSPGGGLCNLDAWARAVRLPDSQVIMLLGEGTFHQVHGGIATNRDGGTPAMQAEYQRVRQAPFSLPNLVPMQWGALHPQALALSRFFKKQQA